MSGLNFVMLIGGPGTFWGCDPHHDKSWSNYIIPMQRAVSKKLFPAAPQAETIHWVVYRPAYRNRWHDDSRISLLDWKEYGVLGTDRQFGFPAPYRRDTNLHQHRKAAADKVLKKKGPDGKYATSYLDRIQQICRQLKIRYHPIDAPGEFWRYLVSLPDNSISRIWFCGHSSPSGLWLDMHHNLRCKASSSNMITTNDIASWKDKIAPKVASGVDLPSQFYGCRTSGFAKKWSETFFMTTEAPVRRINFRAIHVGSRHKNMLQRLRTTPTLSGAKPGWTTYPGRVQYLEGMSPVLYRALHSPVRSGATGPAATRPARAEPVDRRTASGGVSR